MRNGNLIDSLQFLHMETTFLPSRLLFCTPNSFKNSVNSKRKNFFLIFFFLRVDLYWQGRQNICDRVAILASVSILWIYIFMYINFGLSLICLVLFLLLFLLFQNLKIDLNGEANLGSTEFVWFTNIILIAL